MKHQNSSNSIKIASAILKNAAKVVDTEFRMLTIVKPQSKNINKQAKHWLKARLTNLILKYYKKLYRKNPFLSIIIVTFDRDKQLARCLNSIQIEMSDFIEVVIVDNNLENSEERSNLLLNMSKFFSVKHITNNENLGVIKARNLGASAAKGKYIMFLDDDDALKKDFLIKAIMALSNDLSVDLMVAHVTTVNKNYKFNENWLVGHPEHDQVIEENFLPINTICRKRLFLAVKGFDHRFESGFEDWALWVKVLAANPNYKKLDFIGLIYTLSSVNSRNEKAVMDEKAIRRSIRKIEKSKIFVYSAARIIANKIKSKININDQQRLFLELFKKSLPRESKKSAIVIFAPWLKTYGGADEFILDFALQSSKNDLQDIYLLVTEGAVDLEIQYKLSEKGISCFSLPQFLNYENYDLFVNILLGRYIYKSLINFGSPWLNTNYNKINLKNTKSAYYLFNYVGHAHYVLINSDYIDFIFVAYRELAEAFSDLDFKNTAFLPVFVRKDSRAGYKLKKDSLDSANSEKLKIGWIGRNSEEKRPIWFLNLAQNLSEEANFYMLTPDLSKDIKDLFEDSCTFVNHESYDYDFISNLDVLAVTSSIEGIPLAALKALSVGKSIFSTNVGGLGEVSKIFGNCVVSEAEDAITYEREFKNFLSTKHLDIRNIKNNFKLSDDQKFYLGQDTIALINKYLTDIKK